MASESVRDFILQYKAELEDLTSNVKVTINTLSQLADEWKGEAAPSIAALLEKRLLNCDPDHKLPALYLLDSVVKNVRQPYISLFARNLPEVFTKIWQSCESARPQLTKLLGTWHSVFPADMLAVIQHRLGPTSLPFPALANAVASVPVSSQPRPSFTPGHTQTNGAVPLARQHWPFPSANSHSIQAVAPQQIYNVSTYPETSQLPVWGQQPFLRAQQPHQHLPRMPSPQQPTSGALQVNLAPQQPTAPAQPLPAFFNEPDSTASTALALQSLLQAGLLSMPGSNPLMAADQTMLQAPDTSHVSGAESLSSNALKAHNPAVIMSLVMLPEEIKAKHRGVFHRQQQRKRKAFQEPVSRHWYADSTSWIRATTVDASTLTQEQQEAEAPDQPRVVPTVPVDDAQRQCALSGERFETVWDAESEDWHYLGTVRLGAEDAARYGLAEGALVLADCLSSSGPENEADDLAPASEATTNDLPAASESQVAAELGDATPREAALSSPTKAQNGAKRTHEESFPAESKEGPAAASAAVMAVQTAADGPGRAARPTESVKLEPIASPGQTPASEQCRPHDDLSQAAKRVKVEPV